MQVNVRTFSQNPSKYIRKARNGEEVIVMLRDTPAVRLVPVLNVVAPEEQLQRLAAIPGVKAAKVKPPSPNVIRLKGKGLSGSAMLLEDRR